MISKIFIFLCLFLITLSQDICGEGDALSGFRPKFDVIYNEAAVLQGNDICPLEGLFDKGTRQGSSRWSEFDGIFTGILTESVEVMPRGSSLSFSVLENLKGDIKNIVSIEFGINCISIYCESKQYHKGEKYLVYAHKKTDGQGYESNDWIIFKLTDDIINQSFISENDLKAFSQIKGDGIWKLYYDNGQVKLECPYKNEKFDGFMRIYTEDNELAFEQEFVDGVHKDVPKVYFSPAAELISKKSCFGRMIGGDFIEIEPFSNEEGQFVSQKRFWSGLMGRESIYQANGQLLLDRHYESQESKDGSIEKKLTHEEKYDTKGNPVYKKDFYEISRHEQIYQEGKIYKIMVYDYDDNLKNETIYNNNGEDIKVSWYYKDGNVYYEIEYDEKGNVISEKGDRSLVSQEYYKKSD